MKLVDPKQIDFAFVPNGTPMFSDLIEKLETALDLSDTRRRDLTSGLRRVAKALGRPTKDVPCFGRWLQPRLAKIAPAALNLSTKSWQNAVSDARAAMAHFGIVERRHQRASELSPEWQTLWRTVLDSKDRSIQPAVGGFVYFLNNRGVSPEQVGETDAVAYREALEINEISKSPDRAYRAAVNGWNLAVRRIPEWPRNVLPLASRQKVIKLDEQAFPKTFVEEIDALMMRLTAPDPLDEYGRGKSLRPVTLMQYRRQIVRIASELVHSGFPIEAVTGLDTILDPKNAERALRQMLSRAGNKTTKLLSECAALLRNLGKITNQPPDCQRSLRALAGKLAATPRRGITRKNRDRLRILQDERQALRLLNLPERLFNNPPSGKSNEFTKALAREDALAIAILLFCPVRSRNLAGIHVEDHLQRPGLGRVYLVFTEGEVKNERPLEFDLPADLVRMIDRHLASRTPELCPPGTPWLFPRRDGSGPIDPGQLASRISNRIRKEIGIEMNAHLFRHFAVMNWLDANPGAYEVARRLLGHSEVSHTINMYSGLESKSATRSFAELMETRKKGHHK